MKRLALLALLAAFAAPAAEVHSAKFGDIGLDDNVVTNVNLSGFVEAEEDPTVPAWAKNPTPPLTEEAGFNAFTNQGGKLYGPLKLHQPSGTSYDFSTEITTNGVSGWKYTSSGYGMGYWVQWSFDWADLLTSESDPSVYDWAKSPNKPSYTATEVGALPSDTTHLSGDVPTTRTVNGQPLSSDVTLGATDVGAYPNASGELLSTQVSAIGSFLNAEDARFVVTNYDSETGGYSPEGYTQISSSNILIAAGMAYQRTITSGGAVWVLQCNTGTAQIGGDTNGFFRVIDGDGNVQFEIIKGNKREMGCDATGITVGSGSPPVVTIPYSVESAEHPTLEICDDLVARNWKAETASDCIANVSWGGLSGAWVATVQRKAAGNDAMFIKATFMAGGETYIRNVAPVGMDSIMLNGTRYYLGTATISGNTVLTLSSTPPTP